MDSSNVFVVSLSICIGSIWFSHLLHKELFETNEDEADKAKEDASESDWMLYRLSGWIAIMSGLTAGFSILASLIEQIMQFLAAYLP